MAEKSLAASTTTQPKSKTPVPPTPAKSEVEDLSPTRFGDWEKNGRCIDF